jgi:hypothetical protein
MKKDGIRTSTIKTGNMKTKQQIIEKTIRFLNDFVIECKPNKGCGRCDDARKIVSELESELLQQEPEKEDARNMFKDVKAVDLIASWDKEKELTSQTDNEVRSFIKTNICQYFNNCENCGKRYYHNKLYHPTKDRLLCPDCFQSQPDKVTAEEIEVVRLEEILQSHAEKRVTGFGIPVSRFTVVAFAIKKDFASLQREGAVSDEEIERHAKEVFVLANLFSSNPDLSDKLIPILQGFYSDGAKAMRDGKIKSKKKGA